MGKRNKVVVLEALPPLSSYILGLLKGSGMGKCGIYTNPFSDYRERHGWKDTLVSGLGVVFGILDFVDSQHRSLGGGRCRCHIRPIHTCYIHGDIRPTLPSCSGECVSGMRWRGGIPPLVYLWIKQLRDQDSVQGTTTERILCIILNIQRPVLAVIVP